MPVGRTVIGASVPVEEFRAVMYCTCQTVMTGGVFLLSRVLSALFLLTRWFGWAGFPLVSAMLIHTLTW